MDAKVIDRVRKLLALAAGGSGATEAEASLAAEKAAEMMAEHSLSVATIEATGGTSSDTRGREAVSGGAIYAWQHGLMATIAETLYVSAELVRRRDPDGRTMRAVGYSLIGRAAAVAATRVLFDYLSAAVVGRAEAGRAEGRDNRWVKSFREGMSDRLRERLRERHAAREREQAARARAAAERPGAATAGALVVVLADYGAAEREANDELRRGLAPGTLRREREERDRAYAEWRARYDAIRAAEPGIADDLARYLASGWSRARAEEILREYAPKERAPETDAQRARRAEREARERATRRAARVDWGAYEDGNRAGDAVGLDEQVASDRKRRLS